MAAHDYGRYFFSIETPTAFEMAYADRITVDAGCLMLWGSHRNGDVVTGSEVLLLAYSPGQWVRFAAASCFDGGSVAIDNIVRKDWKSTPAMRKTARKFAMAGKMDDYDRAVLAMLDDLDVLLSR